MRDGSSNGLTGWTTDVTCPIPPTERPYTPLDELVGIPAEGFYHS
jgi:hypothetical protein